MDAFSHQITASNKEPNHPLYFKLTSPIPTAYCAVEDNKIKTFSNRSYSYSMGTAWHVVALDDASYAGRRQHDPRQLVLLARRPVPQHQEIYIFYRYVLMRLEANL